MPDSPQALSTGRRVFYVDVVRSCASVLVIFNHVFAPVCAGFQNYSRPVWWFFNLFNSLTRPSAALFVMISGALFLGASREQTYFQFVWKRYSRIFVPFFVWSILYAFYEAWVNLSPLTAGGAVLRVLHGPTEYHLWFMYMILGLYWVMPFLRRFVRAATPGEIAAFLGVWFALLTVQMVLPSFGSWGPLATLVFYGGFAVLGYALHREIFAKRQISWWLAAGLVIIAANAVGTYILTIRKGGVPDDRLYYGAAPLVAIQTAAMYLVFKKIGESWIWLTSGWRRTLTTQASLHSYNVYLNHALFIWIFTKGHLGFTLSEHTGPNAIVGVGLTAGAVLACSLGFSLLVQKIPVVSTLFVISPRT